jgi:exonuclease III
MNNTIAQGPLYGRPFGGVGALIKNSLRCHCETLYAGERFLVLKIYNFIIINVYMPCDGSTDRLHLCEFVLNEILVWREQFSHCSYILAGDLNVELGSLMLSISVLVNTDLIVIYLTVSMFTLTASLSPT